MKFSPKEVYIFKHNDDETIFVKPISAASAILHDR